MYYVRRDLVGYGPVDTLLLDGNIEDVKVSGYGRPFILIHREHAKYGWLRTNIQLDHDSQDRLARRLTLMGKSSLSTAFPMVECMLPNGDRLSAFYQYEISPLGTSITIRRHKAEPYTVIQFIEQGEFTSLMAACFWTVLEAKGVFFMIGQPGSGKTSLVNALGQMIRDSQVPVIIEDFPELNFPQPFKQSLVTRYSKALRTEAVKRGEQMGEVNQEDLLRASLRIRPDYLIVGEILTREAPVFLQAINIGLSGLTSFHAEDVETAVSRLTEKTIGVDPTMLRLIDWIVTVGYVKLERTGDMVRRCRSVDEIMSVGNYQNVFKWNPTEDAFTPNAGAQVVMNSRAFRKVMARRGTSEAAMIAELEEKVNFLEDLRARGMKRFAEVSQAFKDYHASKIPGAPSGVEVAPRAPAEAIVVSIEDRLLKLAQEKAAESSEEEVERS
jgi:flagellar protein FlaI